MNVLADAPDMLAVCDAFDLASVNRGPLAMGLLTGKYGAADQVPGDDVRANAPWMRYFSGGRPAPDWLARLDAVRDVLTSGGRTLAQGALGWLLARSPRTVPDPRHPHRSPGRAERRRPGPRPAHSRPADRDQPVARGGVARAELTTPCWTYSVYCMTVPGAS